MISDDIRAEEMHAEDARELTKAVREERIAKLIKMAKILAIWAVVGAALVIFHH